MNKIFLFTFLASCIIVLIDQLEVKIKVEIVDKTYHQVSKNGISYVYMPNMK